MRETARCCCSLSSGLKRLMCGILSNSISKLQKKREKENEKRQQKTKKGVEGYWEYMLVVCRETGTKQVKGTLVRASFD